MSYWVSSGSLSLNSIYQWDSRTICPVYTGITLRVILWNKQGNQLTCIPWEMALNWYLHSCCFIMNKWLCVNRSWHLRARWSLLSEINLLDKERWKSSGLFQWLVSVIWMLLSIVTRFVDHQKDCLVSVEIVLLISKDSYNWINGSCFYTPDDLCDDQPTNLRSAPVQSYCWQESQLVGNWRAVV